MGRPEVPSGGRALPTDRVLGEFSGREKKKKKTSLVPFFLVFITGSRRNRSLNREMSVTDRNHYAKRSNPVCKFVTFSRPTDRLFRAHPAPDPHWEFVRPRNYEIAFLTKKKLRLATAPGPGG